MVLRVCGLCRFSYSLLLEQMPNGNTSYGWFASYTTRNQEWYRARTAAARGERTLQYLEEVSNRHRKQAAQDRAKLHTFALAAGQAFADSQARVVAAWRELEAAQQAMAAASHLCVLHSAYSQHAEAAHQDAEAHAARDLAAVAAEVSQRRLVMRAARPESVHQAYDQRDMRSTAAYQMENNWSSEVVVDPPLATGDEIGDESYGQSSQDSIPTSRAARAPGQLRSRNTL